MLPKQVQFFDSQLAFQYFVSSIKNTQAASDGIHLDTENRIYQSWPAVTSTSEQDTKGMEIKVNIQMMKGYWFPTQVKSFHKQYVTELFCTTS
ncbi:Hypothetical predicted protein [Octopus vulgaris]|uniref:Uncharacterized protein n=1 Tax=Octopus vulgaris TaxID=6645 RepID=A0AA36B0Z9_OCTVU|nr:Hypothetical predicted protein [Octopus vulgaris]